MYCCSCAGACCGGGLQLTVPCIGLTLSVYVIAHILGPVANVLGPVACGGQLLALLLAVAHRVHDASVWYCCCVAYRLLSLCAESVSLLCGLFLLPRQKDEPAAAVA